MPTALYDKLKQTAIAHAHAYSSSPPWDPDQVSVYRTPDCVQSLHPKESLPSPFNEDLNREQFYQALYFFGSVLTKSTFDIHDVVVDVERRKVAMSLKGIFDLKAVGNDPAQEGFTADYVWILQLNETGKKVSRVDEYLDAHRLMEQVKPRAEKYVEMQK